MDLLMLAEFEDEKAGIVEKSEHELSLEWGWHRSRVHRFIKKLQRENYLDPNQESNKEPNKRSNQLSITNWRTYQIDRTIDRTEGRTKDRTGPAPKSLEDKDFEPPKKLRSKEVIDLSLSYIDPLEAKKYKGADTLDEWASRSTLQNRDDLQERAMEVSSCLALFNLAFDSSVMMTPPLYRKYIELYDLWQDPFKILDSVKGLICEPESWSRKRGLGIDQVWKDPETAERYIVYAKDYWSTGGWEQSMEMKRKKRDARN
jgi:hypothetical protein